jgi:hypothetical protein
MYAFQLHSAQTSSLPNLAILVFISVTNMYHSQKEENNDNNKVRGKYEEE